MTQVGNLKELYKKYFGETKGFFVEVGGFDGKANSNTSILVDQRWSGMYIEPIEEYAAMCRLNYEKKDNIRVVNLAAGEKKGEKMMSVREQNSTFEWEALDSGNFPEDWHFNKETEKRLVKVDMLDSILNSPLEKIEYIDLLIIDTELYEDKVLEGFTIEKYYPRMVIIELHENSAHWQCITKQKEIIERVNGYFAWHKYKKVYVDEINTIFVR